MSPFKAALCGLIATSASLAVSAPAFADIFVPTSYAVTVKSSFGTKFKDCFAFDGAGNLTVSGYGTLTVASKSLTNSSASKFQAVSPLAVASITGFTLAFDGIALGGGSIGSIAANGLNEAGDRFVISGSATSSCPSSAPAVTNSPYHHS